MARLEAGESGHDTTSRFTVLRERKGFGETVFLMMSIFPKMVNAANNNNNVNNINNNNNSNNAIETYGLCSCLCILCFFVVELLHPTYETNMFVAIRSEFGAVKTVLKHLYYIRNTQCIGMSDRN